MTSTVDRTKFADQTAPVTAGVSEILPPGWRRPWTSGVLTALVVMTTAATSIGVVAVGVRDVLLDDLRTYLRRTVETTAALIDGPSHAQMTDSAQTRTPEYYALAKPLFSLLAVNPDIRFAYSATMRGDTSIFILDADPKDPAYIGEPDRPTKGEYDIMRLRRTVVEDRPTPTNWGVGIRAYAPIQRVPGAPFTYVGITMDAKDYTLWLRRLYNTVALGLGVAFLLAVLIGVRAARAERERRRAEHEIAEAWAREDAAAAERRALEQRLERKHRTEALGTLAGGVAHDFNNLLSVILGNAELILLDEPTDSPIGESAGSIKTAATRARDVARQILIFANPRAESRQTVALQQVVEETVHLLASTLPSSITLVWEPPPGDVSAVADESQLTQVLMNLGVNASQALPGGRGTIEFALARVELRRAEASRLGLDVGEYARLEVRDDGAGMSEETRKRIFEPFFTTKAVGEGSGLGLSVVDGVVRAHHGAVEVQSAPGAGAAFTIYLPLDASTPGLTTREQLAAASHRGDGERVLLVDDDAAVLQIVSQLLRKAGYTVDAYHDAEAAMAVLERHGASYDVVITDRTMPRLSGLEVARRAFAHDPGLPTILLSGAVQHGDVDAPGITAVIAKPADAAALIDAVARACATRRHVPTAVGA